MKNRVIRRLGAAAVVAMSLIACGDSGDDGSSADPSTTESPATTAAPVPSTEAPVVTTVAPAPTTAAPVPTTAAPAPTTLAPAPTTTSPAGGGTATCDKESVAAGIGDEVADIVDLMCDAGWAAVYYTDNDGLSRPAILKAEGKLWILQDWYAVCEGDPMVPGDIAVPESLRMYCPGG
ncbi:MAG: hypothetical protein WCP59_07170 [Actinomycetota bacterium]